MAKKTSTRSPFVGPTPLCETVYDTIRIPLIEFPSDYRPPKSIPSTVSTASSASSSSASSRSLCSLPSAPAVTPTVVSNKAKRATSFRRKKVWFGSIQINEHLYELGDNPSVSSGVPLTISWHQLRSTTYEVEYYETYNPSEQRRRTKTGLKLSADDRNRLLLSSGYSMTEILTCDLEIQRQKKAREESARNRKWDNIHATIENTTRKLRKAGRRRSMLTSMSRKGTTTARLGSSMSSLLPASQKSALRRSASTDASSSSSSTLPPLNRTNSHISPIEWASSNRGC